MDEAGKYTAQHTVMESGIEIRELKHLLKVSEDKVEKLQAEIETLRGIVRNIDIEDLSTDPAPVIGFHQDGVDNRTSEGEGLTLNFDDDFGIQFSDKSQLDSDDEEPNKETY
jgi:hypothetical protein